MSKTWQVLWLGTRLRCPSCGKGRIYHSFGGMNKACPVCRVVFEREEGDFLGAIVIAYSVTAVLICAGIFAAEVLFDLSVAAHTILWSAVATLFLLATYRNMKGLWLGILHEMTGLRRED